MSSQPDRKTTSTAARAAVWTVVTLTGAVLASVCIYAIVWIWTGILATVG